MFGKVQAVPQIEDTPFYPRSPYGVAKLYAHWMTVNYREKLRHLRQQRHPVQPRVAAARPRVRHPQDHRRAWPRSSSASWTCSSSATWTPSATGAIAKEYVEGMWRMLQADEPDTFVLATNRTETVRDFVDDGVQGRRHRASNGSGKGERRRRASTRAPARRWCASIPKFYRPAEVDLLIGDPAKAKAQAGLGAEDDARAAVPDDGRGRPAPQRAWLLVLT